MGGEVQGLVVLEIYGNIYIYMYIGILYQEMV